MLFAELRTFQVRALRNAVSEQNQAIAAAQLHFLLMVVPLPQCAEDNVFRPEPLAIAVAAGQDRPVVARIGIPEPLLLQINHAIKEGNKLLQYGVGRDHLIDSLTEFPRISPVRRKHAHGRLQIGH